MDESLSDRIREAAKVLKAYGAREVYVFGSAATGDLDEQADVDLAVTGLPLEAFFEAMGKAGDVLRHQLDLVDLDVDSPFTRYLKEAGELQRVA